MRKNLLLGLFVFALTPLFAQKITGIVKDEQGKGLSNTTIMLLKSKDSSIIKYYVTDVNGKYTFPATASDYLLKFTHVGYANAFSKPFQLSNEDKLLDDVVLAKKETAMQGVTVTAQKPVLEMRADRTVVNVEGTVNAVGNDAFELLRRSPGIMIDKDDNISLSGKNGIQVYIDGKPSPLSGTDLTNYLKSLQSSQIESIELITNPSAKYEAAGNAGIINIKFKKNKAFGTNGSFNLGYNIGTYAKYNGGLSLNHRNAKTNIFGSYNYNQSVNSNHMNFYRLQADTIFDQQTNIKFTNKGSHNFKTGLDYFVNAKSTIGVVVNGNIADFDFNSHGPLTITYWPSAKLQSTLQASTINAMKRNNINSNLNYRYAVTGGKELNIDLDYGFFDMNGNQYITNNYYNTAGTFTNANIYRMVSPSTISISSAKADYEDNYKGGRLGYGGKISYVKSDNDFRRYNVINSAEVYDKDKSNLFKYKENINAAYVNYNKNYKKGYSVQLGLRVENTQSSGNSSGLKNNGSSYINYDSTFNRSYTGFFPSASITFTKKPMSMIGLSYSRRIDRPAYQDLNPFEMRLNDYTYMRGNTLLRPQYTHNFRISHTYKYKLNTALSYSYVKDMFVQVPDTIEKSKSYMTKKNLASQNIVGLSMFYPYSYKKYSAIISVNANYSMYKADFGGGSRKVNSDVFTTQFYVQNTYKLKKGITAELTGFYNSPTIWQGFFKSKAMYFIDAGASMPVLKNKGTLKLAVSDIFKIMKFSGYSNFTGQYSRASGNWESRQLKLSFNYRFGNSQVKGERQRKSGVEEEKNRTQGGDGGGMPVGGGGR